MDTQQHCYDGCGALVGLPDGGMGVMVWKCKPGTIKLEHVKDSAGLPALRCMSCENIRQHPEKYGFRPGLTCVAQYCLTAPRTEIDGSGTLRWVPLPSRFYESWHTDCARALVLVYTVGDVVHVWPASCRSEAQAHEHANGGKGWGEIAAAEFHVQVSELKAGLSVVPSIVWHGNARHV